MKILFIHNNFPGQFKFLAPYLHSQGHQIESLYYANNIHTATQYAQNNPTLKFKQHAWQAIRQNPPQIEANLRDFDTKLIRGYSVQHYLAKNHPKQPDLIIAHVGWGEALFLKEIWPNTPLLGLFEFYYHHHGFDIGFDPEFPPKPDDYSHLLLKNINALLMLTQIDQGYCPTAFQKSAHPIEFQHKLEVIHEGIDTDQLCPRQDICLNLNNQGKTITLTRQHEVITFVNRNLEPYRGYHYFMRALPKLLRQRPNVQVIIIGGDAVSYGVAAPQGKTWKQIYLEEVKDQIDLSRVHFIGHVPYTQFVALLQLSQVHVYLTYPFVLSWSMLEAMSCEALVIGSDTAPVREVIEHEKNGLLVDFFDTEDLVMQINRVFEHPDRMKALRQKARQTIIERYDLKRICLPRQLTMVEGMV